MNKWILVITAVSGMSLASLTAAAQSAGWARPGDTADCIAGSREACLRVHWTFYLWPRLQRELRLIDWNTPQPDPSPIDIVRLRDHVEATLTTQLDGSSFAKVQIEQMKSVRIALLNAADGIAKDIQRLEAQAR